MIKLTLFQNCILNETYREVLSVGKKTGDTKSILDSYLDTLTKLELTLDYVYYENTGEFVIDYDLLFGVVNIYMFNYMKIELYNDATENLILTRYCFIDKIEIKNGCAYVSYKEDVWSSYSNLIVGITKSYLSSSRFHDYVNLPLSIKKLPTEYQSDKNLLINRLNSTNSYEIYMEIQYYKLTSQGETTDRISMIYRLEFTYKTWNFVNGNIQAVINAISEGYIAKYNTSVLPADKYSFEVGNIYVVPSYINFNLATPSSDDIYIFDKADTEICHCRKLDFITELNVGYTTTITNNYKNLKIGTISTQIDFSNLGRDCDLKIFTSASEIDLSIHIGFQNQIIDITEDFRYDMPYQKLRSSEIMQAKIAKELTYKHINTSQVSNIGNWLEELVSLNTKSIFSRFMGAINLGMTEGEGSYHEYQKETLNIPQYSYSNGLFGNSANFLNSYFGICLFQIDSVNDNFVKEYINNYGYDVYEFLDNWSYLELSNLDNYNTKGCNYNSIKFEIANVYGSFPREIARELNSILENGVKIWFSSTLLSDSYVV